MWSCGLWGHSCFCVLQEGGQESEQGCPAGLFHLQSPLLKQIPQFFPTATRGLPVRAICSCVNRCEPQILHQVGSRRACEDLPCCSVLSPIFSSSKLKEVQDGKTQRGFTHQSPSCTEPQLSHLTQLQGSVVLPPHPAGSFLLPSRAGAEPGWLPGMQGPCPVSHVSPAVPSCGAAVPSTQTLPWHRSAPNSPEGLQAGTALPAQEQRGTGRDKATRH